VNKKGMPAIVKACQKQISDLTGLAFANVVEVAPHDSGWHLQVEMLEKESIPHGMDILGVYDVWLDEEGTVLRFARQSTRRRADVTEPLE
jgi:hypothetical protein